MCMTFLKLSVLFLSVTWCPAAGAPPGARSVEPAGVHIRITPDAVELSIRLSRSRGSSAGARLETTRPAGALHCPSVANSAWFSLSQRIDNSTRSRPLG